MGRKQEFRRRQRKSWLRSIGTVGPFAVGALILAALFIIYVWPVRSPIRLLYVGFDVSDDNADVTHVFPEDLDRHIEEQDAIWGGIEKNSLLVFLDIVGSAGNTTKPGDVLVPEVFVPQKKSDYVKARFDEPAGGDWEPFFEYINELSVNLSDKAPDARKYHLIVALNLFHPDGPGGMPPQFNPFVKLVKDGWDERVKTPDNIDLSLFLSHDYGQRNYQHSDPDQISSHFKRTLDLFLQGEDAKLSNIQEITLDLMANEEAGLIPLVQESAARHELVQKPVLLTKRSSDGNVRLGSAMPDPEVGKYFVYRTRSSSPREVDLLWKSLSRKIEHRHWHVENPLDLQRASMLLLQHERLWFSGYESTVDSELEYKLGELKEIVNEQQTARPPQHSIHDIGLRAALDGSKDFDPIDDTPFDLKWLLPTGENGARPRLESWENKIGGRYKRKVHEVWNAIVETKLLDRNLLKEATKIVSGTDFDFSPPINELVFLRRLDTELPRYDFKDSFMRVIREAIQTKDISNKLAAELNPVLLPDFAATLTDLENERRLLEDRLFGFDERNADELANSFGELKTRFKEHYDTHDKELRTIKEFNRSLIEAPHAFRYAVEVLANQPESSFSTEEIENYSKVWREVSSSDSMEVKIADIKTKSDRIKEAHNALFVDNLDVNKRTDIQIDDPEKVPTDIRNQSQRLLLYWPSKFRHGIANVEQDGSNSSRRSVRQTLNSSAVEEAGDAAPSDASENYHELVELANNGFVDSDGHFLIPMVRRVNEERESRLSELEGWPLLATAAKETHLNWPVSQQSSELDSSSRSMIEVLNEFHFKKSDFQFMRLFGDFWGTPIDGKPYVETALAEHNRIISNELLNLEIDMSAKRRWIKANPDVRGDIETTGNKAQQNAKFDFSRSWGELIADLIGSTKTAFGNYRYWKNLNEEPSSTKDDLMLDPSVPPTSLFRQFLEDQYYRGNKFLLSIRSAIEGDKDSRLAEPGTYGGGQIGWKYLKFEDRVKRERDLYLRGWEIAKELPDYQMRGDRSTYALTLKPNRIGTPKLKVLYDAEKKNKTIAFLIDCSNSMKNPPPGGGGKPWPDVVQQLGEVFKRLVVRKDISIELFAFGASRVVDRVKDKDGDWVVANHENGHIKYKYRKDWVKWTTSGLPSIPRSRQLPGNPGDRSNDWDVIYNAGANTLDDLDAAIKELRPFGETPLLAAIYQAIKLERRKSKKNYFVAITDGIDFISGRKINGKAPGPNEPEYNWKSLLKKIADLGQRENIVEYNYLVDPREKIRRRSGRLEWPDGNNGDIRQEKYSAFKTIVSDSRMPNESLADFLNRLFPYPTIRVTRDSRLLAVETRLDVNAADQKLLVSGYEKSVGGWLLDVGANGKFNLNRPARWKSQVPLTGHEYLEFRYRPDDGELELVQPRPRFGPKLPIQNVQVEFKKEKGSSEFLEDLGVFVQPAFDFWAAEDKVTPSPVVSYISSTSPSGRQIILQDYNESASRTVSNMRQFKFCELNRNLLQGLGFRKNTSLSLNLWQPSSPPKWHLLEFYNPGVGGSGFKLLDRSNDEPLELQKETALVLEGIAGNNGDYRIELRYDDNEGYREYTFTVSRSDPKSDISLDCWLIQVVDENGRRNTRVFRDAINDQTPVERVYEFDPDRKLERIRHKFAFEGSTGNDFNDRRKGLFGLMRINPNESPDGFVHVGSGDFEDN